MNILTALDTKEVSQDVLVFRFDAVHEAVRPDMRRREYFKTHCKAVDFEFRRNLRGEHREDCLATFRAALDKVGALAMPLAEHRDWRASPLAIYRIDNDAMPLGRVFRAIVLFNPPLQAPLDQSAIEGAEFNPEITADDESWVLRISPMHSDPQTVVREWIEAVGEHIIEGDLTIGAHPHIAVQSNEAFEEYLAFQARMSQPH